MDAISFVLGIKSSHLRSTHLRDLIHRGRILKTSKINADGTATDGQENGGAAEARVVEDSQTMSQRNDPTTAWVMAVYEDDAGDEQHWKRSITSSGTSEYRINDRVVNAKAYNEALEAENILIKARNFLVFQGDVEAIASQKPHDLTRLIEQISGSLEYKAEYDRLEAEAETAQEDQAFKYNQRRGLNAEIKQYSEQKKEADNYAAKVDERDQAVVTHVLWKLYHFQETIRESGEEIQRHQNELKEHRRTIAKYEERLESAKKAQAKTGREIAKSERTIKGARKEVEERQNSLIPLDEKITISERNLEKYKKRVAEVTQERDAQSKAVDRLKKDLDVVQKAQTKWEDDFKKASKTQGKQLSPTDLQEYNKLRAEVNKQTVATQIKIDNLTRQRKTDQETVNNLKTKVDDCQRQLEKFQAEGTELRARRDAIKAQVQQTTSETNDKKKQLNNMTSKRLQAAQKHTELEEKLQVVLRKMLDATEGRRQTEKEVRARETLAAMKRVFPGVRGRVHDLVKPKQKKFETAVSTVLGRNFDSIVVDSEKTAKDCIIYLREQRAGQATFIPLDTIQVKSVNSNLKGLHQKMRLAIDTIDYDSVNERAISYACGDAMICDDLTTAKYLCYEKRVDAKAVTLDGTVIHKAGLMTGGHGPNDHKNAKKWEDAEVENMRKLADNIRAEIASLPRGHKSIADEEALQAELSGLEQRLIFSREELQAFEKNLESKQKELQFVQSELAEAQPKYKDNSSSLESLQRQLDQNKAIISQTEDTVFAAFCQRLSYDNIRTYEAHQGSLQQEAAQKKLEFATQISKLQNQLAFETQRLQTTNDRIQQLEASSRRDQDLIDSLVAEKDAIQAELVESSARLSDLAANLEKSLAANGEKVDSVAAHRRDLQKRTREIDSTLKLVATLQDELRRTLSGRHALLRRCKIEQIDLPLAAGSASIDALPMDEVLAGGADPDVMDVDGEEGEPSSSRVEAPAINDYGIALNFEDLDDDLKDDASAEQDTALQDAITSLTTALSALAPNMRAVERLTSATERLRATDDAYATSQAAARTASAEFDEVRERRAALFTKAFTHIAEQVSPIYKALTRSAAFPLGGQAYLDALSADDAAPFAAGCRYHAMPPLKRFRDMDALSGGEKTMAALALLFAVHSYAPSPFFVLDEVDAALDVANVARVAAYLRSHAAPGMQFIVISLKAGLFQESECLIGVLRDQAINSSRTVTLDVSIVAFCNGVAGMTLILPRAATQVSTDMRMRSDSISRFWETSEKVVTASATWQAR